MKKALNSIFVIATIVISIVAGIWLSEVLFRAVMPHLTNSILRWIFKFIIMPIVFLDTICGIELFVFCLTDKFFYSRKRN